MRLSKTFFLAALFVLFSFILILPALAETTDKNKLNRDLISKSSYGRADDVAILLSQGADANTINPAGLTPLHLAAGRADAEAAKIIDVLLKNAADIYKADRRGNMPIIEAVRAGTALSVKTLIDNKALVTIKNHNGKSLIKLAEERGDKEIIALVETAAKEEEKKLAELTGGDGLKKHIQRYSMLSCSGQYLKFYKSENPKAMSDEKFHEVIANNQSETKILGDRINALFDITQKELLNIRSISKRLIQQDLDRLETKDNRLYNGFGNNEDLNRRCKKIAGYWDGNKIPKPAIEN